jgi:sugar transferase (PEP-CTERM/EpsH1 system associated)
MVSSARRRLLYVTHRVPYPPDKGDRLRCYHILRYLSVRAEVHLACLADEAVHPDAQAVLSSLCAQVAIVPVRRTRWLRALWSLATGGTISEGAFHVPKLSAILRTWAEQIAFDGTLASSSSVAPYLMSPWLRSVPAVIDLMDVDSQKWLDYANASTPLLSWIYRLEGTRLRRFEQRLGQWARALLLVARAETDLCQHVCPHGPVHTVTNGVDLDYFTPTNGSSREEPGRCVFVGAMDYKPNVDGAVWFCKEVWPALRQRWPEARLAIVGRNPVSEVKALASVPGVEVVGTVPDIRPEIERASVNLVPLQIARGVQNKVLEGLAMRKATVIAPAPMNGLEVQEGTHLLVARTPTEWVEHLSRLFIDPGRRRELGQAGRAFVEEHHRWNRTLAPLSQLLALPDEKDQG